jgi:acyl-coenzyme A synthetase/AMP-(fatty) acid ligase
MQVSPVEVENHLLTHAIVKDCAVVALQDDHMGELPLAYVVRDRAFVFASEEDCREAINVHMNAALAEHKQLTGGVIFVDSLPKSSAGKLQRGEVKKWAESAAEERRKQEKLAAQVQVYVFDDDDDDDDE